MKKKRASKIKVNPPPQKATKPQENEEKLPPFHVMFPIELKHDDKGESTTCWFKDNIDAKKYIVRYKLKPKDYTIQRTLPKNDKDY